MYNNKLRFNYNVQENGNTEVKISNIGSTPVSLTSSITDQFLSQVPIATQKYFSGEQACLRLIFSLADKYDNLFLPKSYVLTNHYMRAFDEKFLKKIKSLNFELSEGEIIALLTEEECLPFKFFESLYKEKFEDIISPYLSSSLYTNVQNKNWKKINLLLDNSCRVSDNIIKEIFSAEDDVYDFKFLKKRLYDFLIVRGDNLTSFFGYEIGKQIDYSPVKNKKYMNFYDCNGRSALFYVIDNYDQVSSHSNFNKILHSVVLGSNLEKPFHNGQLPLDLALEKGSIELLVLLFLYGLKVTCESLDHINTPGISNDLRLTIAKMMQTLDLYDHISNIDNEFLKMLVDEGHIYHYLNDSNGNSLVYYVFLRDLESNCNSEETSLLSKIFGNDKECFMSLMVSRDLFHLVSKIIERKNLFLLDFFLKKGMGSFTSRNFVGKTLYHVAIDHDSLEGLQMLISNLTDDLGLSDLDWADFFLYAASHGSREILSYLISHDLSNINIKNDGSNFGSNALHFACSYKRYENIQLLIDSGIDVNVYSPGMGRPLVSLFIADDFGIEDYNSPEFQSAFNLLLRSSDKIGLPDFEKIIECNNGLALVPFLTKLDKKDKSLVKSVISFLIEHNNPIYQSMFFGSYHYIYNEAFKFILQNDIYNLSYIKSRIFHGEHIFLHPISEVALSQKHNLLGNLIEKFSESVILISKPQILSWLCQDALFAILFDLYKKSFDDGVSFSNKLGDLFLQRDFRLLIDTLWIVGMRQKSSFFVSSKSDICDFFSKQSGLKNYISGYFSSDSSSSFVKPIFDVIFENVNDLFHKLLVKLFEVMSSDKTISTMRERHSYEFIKKEENLNSFLNDCDSKEVKQKQRKSEINHKKKLKEKQKKQLKLFKFPLGYLKTKFNELDIILDKLLDDVIDSSNSVSLLPRINSQIDPVLKHIYLDKNKKKQIDKILRDNTYKNRVEGLANISTDQDYLSYVGLENYKKLRFLNLLNIINTKFSEISSDDSSAMLEINKENLNFINSMVSMFKQYSHHINTDYNYIFVPMLVKCFYGNDLSEAGIINNWEDDRDIRLKVSEFMRYREPVELGGIAESNQQDQVKALSLFLGLFDTYNITGEFFESFESFESGASGNVVSKKVSDIDFSDNKFYEQMQSLYSNPDVLYKNISSSYGIRLGFLANLSVKNQVLEGFSVYFLLIAMEILRYIPEKQRSEVFNASLKLSGINSDDLFDKIHKKLSASYLTEKDGDDELSGLDELGDFGGSVASFFELSSSFRNSSDKSKEYQAKNNHEDFFVVQSK